MLRNCFLLAIMALNTFVAYAQNTTTPGTTTTVGTASSDTGNTPTGTPGTGTTPTGTTGTETPGTGTPGTRTTPTGTTGTETPSTGDLGASGTGTTGTGPTLAPWATRGQWERTKLPPRSICNSQDPAQLNNCTAMKADFIQYYHTEKNLTVQEGPQCLSVVNGTTYNKDPTVKPVFRCRVKGTFTTAQGTQDNFLASCFNEAPEKTEVACIAYWGPQTLPKTI